MAATSPLGKLTPDSFLRRHWQKKPLLVRDAFADFPDLLSPDELAGLACEKGMTSRIIIEKGGRKPWEVLRGPFSARTFRSLPKKSWTLLVNGVDRRVPAVNELLDRFTFLPNWRIDDVMISYAVDRGNVGAHVDNFDVFLIQASGVREWSIEMKPVLEDDFIPGIDVRLLRTFEPDRTWDLERGDMLYLPPRVPHHGVARGDGCVTYSIGFRAPSVSELLQGAVSNALSSMDESRRYSDRDLTAAHPGELTPYVLRKVESELRGALPSGEDLALWFGQYVTEPHDDDVESPPPQRFTASQLKRAIAAAGSLQRAEGTRATYIRLRDRIALFVNGYDHPLPRAALSVAKALTGSVRISSGVVLPLLTDRAASRLLVELVNRGAFYVPDPDTTNA